MAVALVAAWGFFLPFAYLLGGVLEGGVVGAWGAAAVYIVGVSGVYILRFRGGRWKDIEI
jgi:Na+-driven multidrug efflux pump